MNKTSLPHRERKGWPAMAVLLFSVLLLTLLPGAARSQQKDSTRPVNLADTLAIVPDGTEGVQLAIRPEDAAVQKLPPNEFIGKGSTFRIGMGYIQDFTTYVQSTTFKEQMDSLGIS